MSYISLPENLPGMHGLMAFRPAIAPGLTALTNALLCTDEGLSRGERELIGAYVSGLNLCTICKNVHSAVAQCHLNANQETVEKTLSDIPHSDLSAKMKALLSIAQSVHRGGTYVRLEQVKLARHLGATDFEIHDTVLIAALFSFFNRYIDGLGVTTDDTPETFMERARRIAEQGYGA